LQDEIVNPVLAVVIGTHNRLEQLQRSVASVLDQTSLPVRVYVTDAGSTDGTIAYLEQIADPRVVAVLEGGRLGQATAYNRVFRRVTEPYVCWLSDDNEVVNQGLDVAVTILEQDPRIGLVGLKVRDVLGPFVRAPYIGGISPLGILNVNQGVLRTADLMRVGGFSEWFQLYGIDPDLTAKVLLSGLDVVYTRQISVLHYRNWPTDTSTPEFARVMEQQKVSQAKYMRKYAGLLTPGTLQIAKQRLWTWLKEKHPALGELDNATPILGSLPRDWHNIMSARFISVSELLLPRRGLAHLRQRLPRGFNPRSLPEDPVEPDVALEAGQTSSSLP
jgi:GT2 family glycosyltransferase